MNIQRTACGTNAGYQRHVKEHTEPCTACREARRAYMAEYRRNCHPGTVSGYQKHLRRDETPCATCQEAARLYREGH